MHYQLLTPQVKPSSYVVFRVGLDRIAGNIGGSYIWRIARNQQSVDINLAVIGSHELRKNNNWQGLIW